MGTPIVAKQIRDIVIGAMRDTLLSEEIKQKYPNKYAIADNVAEFVYKSRADIPSTDEGVWAVIGFERLFQDDQGRREI